jgi:hypothetical protein
MTINQIGQVREPLMDAPDGASGGGPSAGQPAAPAAPAAHAAAPEPIELSDDALIKVRGSDKPVKFGEHVKGFQSQFTKASQEAARLRQALKEREDRIRQFEEAQRKSQSQQGNEDVFAALRSLPYLKGEDAVQLVQEIGQEIRQRDMIMLAALRKIQELERVASGLHEVHSSGAFDAKINKWLTDGGYPLEAADLAKEIYLAYEGDDLDNEFPRIFEERWRQIEKVIEAQRQQKIRAARPQPFVPGRGGDVKPSRPLEIKPASSSRDVAEELFNLFGQTET